MNRNTKRLIAIGAPLAAVAATGIAFAAWTSTGSGSGSATSVATQSVSFSTDSASVVNQLYPTGKADVAFTVNNPNSYKVALSSFSLVHAYYSTDAAKATPVETTCDLSLASPTTAPTVNGGATAGSVVLTNALSMGNNAAQACANKTFVLDLSATATSAS